MKVFSFRRFVAASALSFVALHACLPTAFAEEADPATVAPADAAPAPESKDGKALRHGSRAKASDGTMVVYDKVNGIYLVPARKDTFWVGERFYQNDNGVWLSAAKLGGPWTLTAQQRVPDSLKDRFRPSKTAKTAKLPSGGEAVYDPALRAYKIAGKKGVFLFDGMFYFYNDGLWQSSSKEEGPWSVTSTKTLPAPLRKAVPAPTKGQTVKLSSGETVVYDAKSKLFDVQGSPNVVLFDGTFYEMRDKKWFSSAEAASGFEEVVGGKVPGPVAAKYRRTPAGGGKAKANAKKKPAVGEKKNQSSKARPATEKAGSKQAAKKAGAKAGAQKAGGAKARAGAKKAASAETETPTTKGDVTTTTGDE